jgi:glutamine phosphoribosylpyrophosphate amidotransferase
MLAAVEGAVRGLGRVRARSREGDLLRLEIATERPAELARAIESIGPGVEIVSMGRRLEIVKQVGAPRNLDTEFGLARMPGTHGIGHTRLSTESRVDLSHSQPFWAHGTPDLAIVHNGHITNYHRLRRLYEQDGVRFYTDNDSEIVGVHLGRALAAGATLREALEASVRELDGSFSILAATATEIGFAKDPFCLKPLIVGESESALAIANEEVALQAAFTRPYTAREAGSRAVSVWTVPAPDTAQPPGPASRATRRASGNRRAA